MSFDPEQITLKFERILLDVLDAVLERYSRDAEYHFIDTKLDIITGKDCYPPAPGEEFKGKDVIYSWIQGRGLEALAGHARWLPECSLLDEKGKLERINKIDCILEEVTLQMEKCRARNNGRMFFTMSPDGQFLRVEDCSELLPLNELPEGSNYSDLFYSKGLMAAAAYLGWDEKLAEAEIYFEKVIEDIRNKRFITDQQMFDPKNPVTFVPGKNLQGPWMIALSGTAAAVDYFDREKWLKISREMIQHIFDLHINTGQEKDLCKFDYWEAVDDDGRPWNDQGRLVSDPGHALEFVGLSLKCILKMDAEDAEYKEFLDLCRQVYPELLLHSFELGFAPGPGGVIKAFDLKERKPLNTDMPWWSLPETIRAAAEVFELTGNKSALPVISKCTEAFLNNYLNPEACNMAYQTRNAQGEVVKVIPATPDADPGYHTGLSLIDALILVKRFKLR
jgi:mannose/cellobiose epimerase-like protein (N-acyl-D-glucosamine 2-epimerase family)